jgi:hypothetical protein
MLGKAAPPAHDGDTTAVQLGSNRTVAQPVGGQQNDAATKPHPLRRSQLTNRLLKVRAIGLAKDNRDSAWTRHRSLLGEFICLFHSRRDILS